ncbi:MAG: acetyl-CoA carboxylase carboxyltransferase subunit beta [Rhizobiaceae bacterium]|nr:acetyl-CoA carboxylase carboxyltransferase subunit beta [Rhizobiaceae bacterium]
MNWITNFVRPKIGSLLNRTDMPENLWIKCPESGEMVFYKDLEKNMGVMPASGYHMRITALERLKQFFDDGKYELFESPKVPTDPLKFRDKTRYADKLKDAKRKTEMDDSVLAASGLVNGVKMIAVVHEMSFIGGSLGLAAGETIVRAMIQAAKDKCALALFAASGGARMQEGIFSLMQMPRTTVARQMMRDAGAPYIVVLTNPTTGGVSASYAMLGDIHIAEPGAVIGFAGRRVIEQTIREKLPDDFQTSEYLMEHGMVDMIVERSELKPTISRIVRMMQGLPAAENDNEPADSDTSSEEEEDDTVLKIVDVPDGESQPEPAEPLSK